jgi:diguanylate cyclase (GGDEF)-like protein
VSPAVREEPTPSAPATADGLLADAVETLRAIRAGEVDALVVADGSPGEQIFTLSSADRPYRMFVEHMRDGAATVSSTGVVLYANTRLAELLCRPLSEIIGASLTSFVVERHHAALAAQSAEAGTGGTVQAELIGPEREVIPVRIGAWKLEVDFEQLDCLTFTDLTQTRRDQEELDRARETAIKASRLNSAFAANAIVLPLVLATVGLVVLRSAYAPVTKLAVLFAAAAMMAVLARLAVSFRAQVRMLSASREEALTDPLTDLGNRRSLLRDLHRTIDTATEERPVVLALFDLNGFKHYNDTYGHQSGDALLTRLGLKLATSVAGCGSAYRMGGDEFCVLIEKAGGPGCEAAVESAARAMSETGTGFSIAPAHGQVEIPLEAQTSSEALRISDQRMYTQKQVLRPSASRQSRDVLLRALIEHNSDLGDHLGKVGPLAERVARHLKLDPSDVEQIRHAADLHDVGKVAIPDEILNKPGPLTRDERAFVQRHTLVGERIVSAAPALRPAGVLVRSTHERWDGKGYPNGLCAESIPIGSRIVAVCDAFDAMTSERPYNRPKTEAQALEELRRCAGTQFDPAIVTAFEAVSAQPAFDRATGAQTAGALNGTHLASASRQG